MKKLFKSFNGYLSFVAVFWVIATLLLVLGCHYGIISLNVALFISFSIAWVAIAIFLIWIFATDGREAWKKKTTHLERIVIRILLTFYAACIVTFMSFLMVRIMELL